MAFTYMIGTRLTEAIRSLIPWFTGKEQDALLGLADAAAGAAYDAAYDHIEVLEDFRTDAQSTLGASLIGTEAGSDVQTELDTLRQDISELGGGGGGYAADSAVVHNTGAETVAGVKTFTDDPVVLKADAAIGVGAAAALTRNGGVANLGADGVGDIAVFSEHAGGSISLRPEGRTSSTNELLVEGGTVSINGVQLGFRNLERTTTFNSDAAGKVAAIAAGVTLDTGNAAGTTFIIYNDSASSITLTQGTGLTLRLGGTSNTGNRTIAARGMAQVWCNSTTEYIVTGTGVT